MRIQHFRTSHPMNSVAFVDQAKGWASELEHREAMRSGATRAKARLVVATRTSLAPGTLENLARGRLKAIAVHVYERLRSGLIREWETELVRLEHELSILRQTGVDPRDNQVAAVVAGISAARQALGLDEET